ncbi:MAG: cupin domain-containing protein [Chloroflexi bacterium]|nr:MAG: cupin domain-containing protein [Chloroflexota bacterium]MBL1195031.1 cupin domain-containing protein [Chloroflexota bacterium]NOH12320.1 cupin domain-containing protein [Chloroflexota bacterium]
MKKFPLLEKLEFRDDGPYAQPLWVDEHSRILRFMLKPGQSIDEHRSPRSPFYVVVLQGHGIFTGSDGVEQKVSTNTFLRFEPGENHSVRALDKELVFIGFLEGFADTPPTQPGGLLGRSEEEG